MVDFESLIRSRLNERKEDEVISLWNDLYDAYERNGPEALERVVLDKLNELKKGVNKEVKDIKGVIPTPKKRKGRRR
ncbi:MAG: hypothetical protein M1481_02335 [Candidatus Thermoplasmatota archaeon]|nr:hypothetical protein [Candidatus Thermoplasmatota archaeon]MCL5962782.1 hypothetical protein [Candidatus Thermoplasmatota archaeon]